jgi:hypothetical protein
MDVGFHANLDVQDETSCENTSAVHVKDKPTTGWEFDSGAYRA